MTNFEAFNCWVNNAGELAYGTVVSNQKGYGTDRIPKYQAL